jgi:hypothetical protein
MRVNHLYSHLLTWQEWTGDCHLTRFVHHRPSYRIHFTIRRIGQPCRLFDNPRTYVPTTFRFLQFSKDDLQTPSSVYGQKQPGQLDHDLRCFESKHLLTKPSIELNYAYERSRIRYHSSPDSIFKTAVDVRSRLRQLGPTYFPNTGEEALLTCSSTLLAVPTSDLAREIHVVPYTPALTHWKVLDESLLWIAVKFDISKLTTGFQCWSGSLMVTILIVTEPPSSINPYWYRPHSPPHQQWMA